MKLSSREPHENFQPPYDVGKKIDPHLPRYFNLQTCPAPTDLSQLTTSSRKRKISSCGSSGGNVSDEVRMMIDSGQDRKMIITDQSERIKDSKAGESSVKQ